MQLTHSPGDGTLRITGADHRRGSPARITGADHRRGSPARITGAAPARWISDTMTSGGVMEEKYRNPLLTVDIIIERDGGVVMVERRNPPRGWALPGGFVDYGESLESAAIREAREETSLEVRLIEQFHAYSNPDRDPRRHTATMVFIARASGALKAADDARSADILTRDNLPRQIAFDHEKILEDYFRYKSGVPKEDIFRLVFPD